MELLKTIEEWKPMLTPVIESKVNEFLLMGYSKTTPKEVWDCLVNQVWKDDSPKRLHEIVQDILHLSSTIYMNYLTMNTYKDDDLMASIAAVTN